MAEYPLLAISRLRMEVDGVGVTTLVAGAGCPLSCRWCINRTLLKQPPEWVSAQTLFDRVAVDDLYFQATCGGVTFGGGEALLHTDFFRDFRTLCGSRWQLTAETSLNVPRAAVEAAAETLDAFIVDIKTDDAALYRSYTGAEAAPAWNNLRWLLAHFDPARIRVRVPLIPQFNTPAQQHAATEAVRGLGAVHVEAFPYIIRQP